MGGSNKRKKRNVIPPTKSVPRTPVSTLKPRYDFEPRTDGQAPAKKRQASLRDYPPPRQLHMGSKGTPANASPSGHPHSPAASGNRAAPTPPPLTAEIGTIAAARASPVVQTGGASSSATQTTPTPQSHQALPSHLRPSQSPHSSQAQNMEEDEEVSDPRTLPEPNLSDDHLEALNELLNAPRPKQITILDPDLLEPDSTWFGFDKSALTRAITRCFTRKFNGPYYSWSCVPRDRQEQFFVEFAKKHRWHPSLTGLVQEKFESIILLRLKDMVSNARRENVQPKWIKDSLWLQMKTHWSTEDQKAKSETFSANRLSDRKGLGPHVHTSGQKSYRQIEQEMEIELQRPVSFGEVFIRAHTKKDGTTIVDQKAKQVADEYLRKKRERLAELESEITELSDGCHPVLSIEEDNELFVKSTFTNSRGELFGFGSLKSLLMEKGPHPGTSASFKQVRDALQRAEQLLKDQAAMIKRQEEENARLAAAQKAQAAEVEVMKKFLHTDDKFIAFLSKPTQPTLEITPPANS